MKSRTPAGRTVPTKLGPGGILLIMFGLAVSVPPVGAQSGDEGPEADAKRKVPSFTNEDLQRYSAEQKAGGSTDEEAAAEENAVPGAEGAEPGSDREARKADEEYWRGRGRTAREAVKQAEDDLDKAKARLDEPDGRGPAGQPLPVDGMKLDPHRQLTKSDERLRREEDVKDAEAALERARQDLADLEEEARQAGALPGWLRE